MSDIYELMLASCGFSMQSPCEENSVRRPLASSTSVCTSIGEDRVQLSTALEASTLPLAPSLQVDQLAASSRSSYHYKEKEALWHVIT